jgi:hypothetical protein
VVVISSNFELSYFEADFEASKFEASDGAAPRGGDSGFKGCWFTGPLWLIELQVKGYYENRLPNPGGF